MKEAGVPREKKGQGMEVGSRASGRYPPRLLLSVGIRTLDPNFCVATGIERITSAKGRANETSFLDP